MNDEPGLCTFVQYFIINKSKIYYGVRIHIMECYELRVIKTLFNRFLFNQEVNIKFNKKSINPLYIIPSMLVKTNLIYMQIDLSTRAEYKNLMAGVSYRYQDAVALLAGLNLKGLRLGVSYDLTTGSLRNASNGSVEVFAGYCYTIRPRVKMSSLYNTRYL